MKKLIMWLLVIGGLNMGIMAISGWSLASLNVTVAKIIYIIIGLAAVAAPFVMKNDSGMSSSQ